MLSPEKQQEVIHFIFQSAKEFYYISKTSQDPLLIRYAQERLKFDFKKAKKDDSIDIMKKSILIAGALEGKKQIEYEKIYKKNHPSPPAPTETIASKLKLPERKDWQQQELLRLGFLAVHLGLRAPNVVIFTGIMAHAIGSERSDFSLSDEFLLKSAIGWVKNEKEMYKREKNSARRDEKIDKIMWLENYLKKHFPGK